MADAHAWLVSSLLRRQDGGEGEPVIPPRTFDPAAFAVPYQAPVWQAEFAYGVDDIFPTAIWTPERCTDRNDLRVEHVSARTLQDYDTAVHTRSHMCGPCGMPPASSVQAVRSMPSNIAPGADRMFSQRTFRHNAGHAPALVVDAKKAEWAVLIKDVDSDWQKEAVSLMRAALAANPASADEIAAMPPQHWTHSRYCSSQDTSMPDTIVTVDGAMHDALSEPLATPYGSADVTPTQDNDASVLQVAQADTLQPSVVAFTLTGADGPTQLIDVDALPQALIANVPASLATLAPLPPTVQQVTTAGAATLGATALASAQVPLVQLPALNASTIGLAPPAVFHVPTLMPAAPAAAPAPAAAAAAPLAAPAPATVAKPVTVAVRPRKVRGMHAGFQDDEEEDEENGGTAALSGSVASLTSAFPQATALQPLSTQLQPPLFAMTQPASIGLLVPSLHPPPAPFALPSLSAPPIAAIVEGADAAPAPAHAAPAVPLTLSIPSLASSVALVGAPSATAVTETLSAAERVTAAAAAAAAAATTAVTVTTVTGARAGGVTNAAVDAKSSATRVPSSFRRAWVDTAAVQQEAEAAMLALPALSSATTAFLDASTKALQPGAIAVPSRSTELQPTLQEAKARQWARPRPWTEAELAEAETRYTPALTFRFPLDKFQRQAIAHMELETPRAAVFVAAHTGSGKTVIAEYAIAMALASKSRAVYSSPFKALCNQKFYDLRKAFRSYGDDAVGLITGDTVINADASILVMTTEVLRSMLYNSSSVIREISWVVFDEIHYITNEERGLAYEEVLLMLPRSVGLIFLSATSPNKEEFGEWVGTVKQQPVFIVSTNKRTVPLRHYIAVGGSLFPVLEGAQHEAVPGTGWSQEKFAAACAAAARHSGSTQPGSFFSLPMVQDEEPFGKAMLEALRKEDLLPAIVFCSAIALCFDYARMALQWNVCLLDSGEVAEVNSFLRRSMESMPREGVDLPQVEEVRRLLCAGIGVHNAGLMPILKEVTELLFARGKLKLLFATESVATGMNLPARAVLFKGLFKVRDKNVRDTIKPTEYQQMAGRAGRRGIDETGAVIVSLPRLQAAAQPKVREIMSGAAEQLRSQFRLTYHMILNVLRADIPVTRFLERSFVQKRNTPMPLLTEARVQWRQGARLRDQWNALLSKYEEADVSAAVQGGAPATASPAEHAATAIAAASLSFTSFASTLAVLAAEHGKMLHLMLSNYASMDKHLCPGRVVVLRRVLVNPAKLNGADPAAAAAATKELYYVPAVILQRASGAGAAGAPAEASGWGSPVVIGSSATALTPDQQAATRFHLMLLTPADWNIVTPDLPEIVGGASASAAPAVSEATLAAAAASGMGKMIGKGAKDDDDLGSFLAIGGKGGKGGKGGARGAKGAAAVSTPPRGAAGGASDTAVAAAAAAAAPALDREMRVGQFQRVALPAGAPSTPTSPLSAVGGSGNGASSRVFGVLELTLADIVHVTSLTLSGGAGAGGKAAATIGTGGGHIASTVMQGKGSKLAFDMVAARLWQQVALQGADMSDTPRAGTGSTDKRAFPLAAVRLPLVDDDLSNSAADLKLRAEIDNLWKRVQRYPAHTWREFTTRWRAVEELSTVKRRMAELRSMFSFSRLEHFADLQQRLRLLQEMDYIKLEDATASAPDGSAGGAAAAAAALDLSSEAQDLDVRSSSGYVLDIKGRVAAEITMTNEVLFTELLFGSIFGPLTPPECIALMSMFVGRLRKYERVSLTAVVIEDEAQHVANMEAATAAAHSSSASGGAAAAAAETPDGLLGVLPAGGGGAAASSVSASPRGGGVPPSTVLRTTRRLQEAVRIVLDTAAAVEQKQHQLHIDALHAVLLPENVDFFYCWAMGDPVRQLFQLTRVLEGEAVRLALRLDEFCRQIINCARIMGNADLVAKMEMASRAVRRQLTDSCSIIATRDILD